NRRCIGVAIILRNMCVGAGCIFYRGAAAADVSTTGLTGDIINAGAGAVELCGGGVAVDLFYRIQSAVNCFYAGVAVDIFFGASAELLSGGVNVYCLTCGYIARFNIIKLSAAGKGAGVLQRIVGGIVDIAVVG